jgi:D-glycero-D-manno-heptose 1,7-bisphosphate phosphatase
MPQYVLLDRDGVINRKLPGGYVTSWREFEFLPGALEALRLLKENGCKSLVISNQAAVGKGLMTMAQLSLLTRRFLERVQNSGGQIHGVYYCPHTPEDDCNCRKPKPGLILKAQREHRFSPPDTPLIGDSESDRLAASAAGCRFIRVDFNKMELINNSVSAAQTSFPSLLEAVKSLLASREAQSRRGMVLVN